jgi:hypothetical protein
VIGYQQCHHHVCYCAVPCARCVLLQVRVAEQEGIVFIDEIDKIVNPSGAIRHGETCAGHAVTIVCQWSTC